MIDWLIAERATLPPPGQILAPPEQERYDSLRSAKRRADWLIGRWAAKLLLRRQLARRGLDLPSSAIMVLSEPDGAPRIAPWGAALALPHVAAELEAAQISISHCEDKALCAMYPGSGLPAIGADIERVAARGSAFAAAYDSEPELELLASTPTDSYELLSTAIWSAKEAALKLTRHGLRVDTRSVTCLPAPPVAGGWAPIAVSTALTSTPLVGRWREVDGYVITVVTTRRIGRGEASAQGEKSGLRV